MHREFICRALAALTVLLAGTTPAPAGPAQEPPPPMRESFEAAPAPGGEDPPGWRSIRFGEERPATRYRVVGVDGRRALQAEAEGSSSFLVWEREFDPSRTPILEWEWKISGTVPRADLRVEDQEDAPARVVVLFSYDPDTENFLARIAFEALRQMHGEYPPARVLSYVWGNRMPRDSWIVSTFSERIRIHAVESGDARAGRWRKALRDIAADYRAHFAGPLPKRARIGIVVDTDDTAGRTVSWFDNIRLRPAGAKEVAVVPGDGAEPALARSGG